HSLSLHDALPISLPSAVLSQPVRATRSHADVPVPGIVNKLVNPRHSPVLRKMAGLTIVHEQAVFPNEERMRIRHLEVVDRHRLRADVDAGDAHSLQLPVFVLDSLRTGG